MLGKERGKCDLDCTSSVYGEREDLFAEPAFVGQLACEKEVREREKRELKEPENQDRRYRVRH